MVKQKSMDHKILSKTLQNPVEPIKIDKNQVKGPGKILCNSKADEMRVTGVTWFAMRWIFVQSIRLRSNRIQRIRLVPVFSYAGDGVNDAHKRRVRRQS